jgi:hypothetical protein
MSLKEKINEDLKKAMKEKDAVALRGIRAIKAAILLADTDASGKVLDEAGEIRLLQKLVKQRQDSLDIYKKQNSIFFFHGFFQVFIDLFLQTHIFELL